MKKVGIFSFIFLFMLFFVLPYQSVEQNLAEQEDINIVEEEASLPYIEDEWLLQVDSYEEALEIAIDYQLILESVSDYGIATYSGTLDQVRTLKYYQEDIQFQRNYLYYTSEVTVNDPGAVDQFALDHLNAYQAWDNSLGDGILVAVIDTGVDAYHEDLSVNLSPLSYNATYETVGLDHVLDDVGHGTMVSGVIAAVQNNALGVVGIAPGAEILAIKANIDNEGSFEGQAIANGIYYAVEQGADIINMSLGGTYADEIMQVACDYALSQGVIVVAAAGNDGLPIKNYPAGFDSVISVGATTINKERAAFSNFHRTVDIAAPGQDIYTTMMGNQYGFVNGTSFASPYAAGVIALLKAYFPLLSNEEILNHLYATAEDLGNFGKDSQFGYGLVNAYDAMEIPLMTVSFETFSGSAIDNISVAYGRAFYTNLRPTLDGYYFEGWYKDSALTMRYDFENEIVLDHLTLYAKYEVGDMVYPDDYDIIINPDDTVKIMSYYGDDVILDIPDTLYNLPVTEIGEGAFILNQNITDLVVPDSVKYIGSYAFAYMASLQNVTIGLGLETLDPYVFAENTSLLTVEIQSQLLTSIPEGTFLDCTAVNSIILPDSITYFGSSSFFATFALHQFDFPESLEYISYEVFMYSGIENVILPDSLTTIDNQAFYGATYMETLHIGASLNIYNKLAFGGIGHLQSLTISEENQNFVLVNDVLYSTNMEELIWYMPYNTADHFDIPSHVLRLRPGAFSNAQFSSVGFNNQITVIPEEAFSEAVNLESVILPEQINRIDKGAFRRNYALESFVFPRNLEEIPANMFDRCISLKEVVFSDNLMVIGSSAFVASGVEKIILPETVRVIKEWVFISCNFLEEVYVPDTVEEIGYYAFHKIGLRRIPTSLKTLGEQGIDISRMKSLILPISAESVDTQWIQNMNYITEVIDFGGAKDVHLCGYNGSVLQKIVVNAQTETVHLEATSYYNIHLYVYGMNTTLNLSNTNYVIHGYSGSQAEQYAIDHNILFVNIDRTVVTHSVSFNLIGVGGGVGSSGSNIQDQEFLEFEIYLLDGYMVYEVKANGDFLVNVDRHFIVNVDEDIVIDIVIKPIDYLLEYDDILIENQRIIKTMTNAEVINYPSLDSLDQEIIGFDLNNDYLTVTVDNIYNSINGGTFPYGKFVKQIRFPETVTDIPIINGDFYYVENLYLPEGIETIGGFEDLANLESLILPSTLTAFPGYVDEYNYPRGVFDYCPQLESLVIKSDLVTDIPGYAFYEAFKFKNLYMASDVLSIGEFAFYNAVSMRDMIINDDSSVIDDSAFMFQNYGYYILSFTAYPEEFGKLPLIKLSSTKTAVIDYATLYGIPYDQENKISVAYINQVDDENLQSIVVEQVIVGNDAMYSGIPSKPSHDSSSYVFDGWDQTLLALTSHTMTYATYQVVDRLYEVQFVDEDTLEVLGISYVHYCESATHPTNTEKASNPKYDYVFYRWDFGTGCVLSDMVVHAEYFKTLRTYEVNFYDWDGEVFDTQVVGYGLSASSPYLADEGFNVFDYWDTDISYIYKDIDVYPIRQGLEFSVNFYDYYGDFITSVSVIEGDAAEAPIPGDIGDHVFVGWNKDISAVTENMDVYAVYAPLNMSVTFVEEPGETIGFDLVVAGEFTSLFVSENNRVYLIGKNVVNPWFGAGAYDMTDDLGLNASETIIDADLGFEQIMLLTSEHRVIAIGTNEQGMFGVGEGVSFVENINDITSYIPLNENEYVMNLSISSKHTILLTSDLRILVAGSNEQLQLGLDAVTSVSSYTDITSNFSFEVGEYPVEVIATECRSALVTNFNHIYLWGDNGSGQSGNGTFTNHYLPYLVNDNIVLNSGETIVAYDIERHHNFVLTSEQRVFSWGSNYYHQTGVNNYMDVNIPTDISDIFNLETDETIVSFHHGYATSYVLTSHQRLLGWGLGSDGQLGMGYRKQYNSIVLDLTAYFNLENDAILNIYAGSYHAYVLTENNHLYVFGSGGYNRTGTYYDYTLLSPVEIIFTDGLKTTEYYTYGDDVTFPVLAKEGNTFIGWYYDYQLTMPVEEDFELIANQTFYPLFEPQILTVRFWNQDGTSLKVEEVVYGGSATAPPDPTLPPTAEFTYTFDGWDISFDDVTEDIDVFAIYTSVVNEYTVRFLDDDGAVLKTEEVAYGSSATPPDDPSKDSTAEFTYTFAGWDVSYDVITGNLDVTATYASIVNEYTVRFLDEDGAVLKAEEVPYGSSATPPDDPSKLTTAAFIYTFDSWDQDFDYITGALDVNAIYISTPTSNYYRLAPGVDTIYLNDVWVDGGLEITNEHITYQTLDDVDTSILENQVIRYHLFYDDIDIGEVIRVVSVLMMDEAPEITLNPGVSTLFVGETYIEAGASTTIGEIEIISDIDTSTSGIYMVIYRVTIDSNVYEKVRYVVVYALYNDWNQAQIFIPQSFRKEEEDESI